MNRRSFVRKLGAGGAGLAFSKSGRSRMNERNDEVVMAVIGIHGQGRSHLAARGKSLPWGQSALFRNRMPV